MLRAELDFSAYIAERTRDFTGREWVFAEIDRWLADPDAPRYFIITGEPGIGKTAIAASLTQIRDLAAVHFCITRRADTIDPLNFVRSLSHQLTRLDQFAQCVLKEQGVYVDVSVDVRENYGQIIGVQIENLIGGSRSATIAFNHTVADPLKRLYGGEFDRQMVILVDALDRAVRHHGPETIVDLVADAHGLPSQVRFVLTSRPEGTALRHFEQLAIPYLVLDGRREENLEDIRVYVRHRLETSKALQKRLRERGMQRRAFIERATEASQGNFLYLIWLLRAVEESVQQVDALETLPRELGSVYREFLRACTIGEDIRRWRDHYRPLLGVLAAAQAPLTAEQLAEFSALEMQKVADFLVDSQQFIYRTEDGKYRLYHQSLRDFLGTLELAGEFWIDLESIHRQIVISFQARYHTHWDDIDDYGVRFLLYHIVQCRPQTNAQGAIGQWDKYAVKWLFLHLKRQGRANDIGRFVNQVFDS